MSNRQRRKRRVESAMREGGRGCRGGAGVGPAPASAMGSGSGGGTPKDRASADEAARGGMRDGGGCLGREEERMS